jgi:hypothetical protein
MKKLLFATALCALAAPAYADTTAYHVGATSDGGPGGDPNDIATNVMFFIADNPNKDETGPLSIFFAVPEGEVDPTISKITYNGGSAGLPFTGPVELTNLGDYTAASGVDFYTFVGCTSCNKSLNFVNFTAGQADTTLPSAPTAYDVFKAVVTIDFTGKDFIDVQGLFAEGTYIAPLSGDGVDTSFTNAGLITGDAVINPVITPTVPEPSTWAMLISGFGLMGLFGWRKHKIARYAV